MVVVVVVAALIAVLVLVLALALVIVPLPLLLVAAAGVKGEAGEGGTVVGSSRGGSHGSGSVRRSSSSSINRFAIIVILGYLEHYSTAVIEYRIHIIGHNWTMLNSVATIDTECGEE